MIPAHLLVTENGLHSGNKLYRCAIGRSGFSADKKEGDGCTPTGTFPLRECWYRADRLSAPETTLPLRVIMENDGWCDDPRSKEYNRHIKVPRPVGGRLGGGHFCSSADALPCMPPPQPSPYGGGSFEHLWRSDHVYDLIISIGYNDDPVIPGKGSAIFLHVAEDNYKPTEGCVAMAEDDLLKVLKQCNSGTMIEIREG